MVIRYTTGPKVLDGRSRVAGKAGTKATSRKTEPARPSPAAYIPRPGRPRIEDRGKTITARKPWAALGMSRRTWYRRQAEKREAPREMNEMVEQVAKAIQQAVSTGRPWESESPSMKEFYRACAAGALNGMREPTEAMLNAKMAKGGYGYGDDVYEADPKDIWQAMIDAALK